MDVSPTKLTPLAEYQALEGLLDGVTPLATRLPPEFDFASFSSRYLCGDIGLREARGVSRMRLALQACGIPSSDVAARALNEQARAFDEAVDLLSQRPLTLELLKQANRLLLENQRAGEIRRSQSWVGKRKDGSGATFIPPAAEDLDELMQDLLDYINQSDDSPLVKAYVAQNQLISIHPFVDGNGRTSRALWSGLASHHQGAPAHPLLFRLRANNMAYDAHLKLFRRSRRGEEFAEHIQDSVHWSNNYLSAVETVAEQTRKNIASKLGLTYLDSCAQQVLKDLWRTPIIYPEHYGAQRALTIHGLMTSIQPLLACGVLKARLVRESDNRKVLICPDICELYSQAESLIFN